MSNFPKILFWKKEVHYFIGSGFSCKIPESRKQEHISLKSIHKYFPTAHEGKIWCLFTVNFGEKVDFCNSSPVYCLRLHSSRPFRSANLHECQKRKTSHWVGICWNLVIQLLRFSWNKDNSKYHEQRKNSKKLTLCIGAS